MSVQITEAMVDQFKDNVRLSVQQTESAFSPFVSGDTYEGEGARPITFVGIFELQERTDRHARTNRQDMPHESRWIEPRDFSGSDLQDKPDMLRTIHEFENPYVQAITAGAMRKKDTVLIDQIFAASKTGARGENTTAFPASQVAGTTAGGLTVTKTKEARELLDKQYVPKEQRYLGTRSKDQSSLMSDVQVTSRDFNGGEVVMRDGMVRRVQGFDLIHYEDFEVSGTDTWLPAYHRDGLHIGTWDDLDIQVDRMPDFEQSIQIWGGLTVGGARLEEKRVVKVVVVT